MGGAPCRPDRDSGSLLEVTQHLSPHLPFLPSSALPARSSGRPTLAVTGEGQVGWGLRGKATEGAETGQASSRHPGSRRTAKWLLGLLSPALAGFVPTSVFPPTPSCSPSLPASAP